MKARKLGQKKLKLISMLGAGMPIGKTSVIVFKLITNYVLSSFSRKYIEIVVKVRSILKINSESISVIFSYPNSYFKL